MLFKEVSSFEILLIIHISSSDLSGMLEITMLAKSSTIIWPLEI